MKRRCFQKRKRLRKDYNNGALAGPGQTLRGARSWRAVSQARIHMLGIPELAYSGIMLSITKYEVFGTTCNSCHTATSAGYGSLGRCVQTSVQISETQRKAIPIEILQRMQFTLRELISFHLFQM